MAPWTSGFSELEKDLMKRCQAVFAGPNATIKQQKAIRGLILKNQKAFQPLVEKYGSNRVVGCCQDMLKRGVFLECNKTGYPEPPEPSEGDEPEDEREENIDPLTDGSLPQISPLFHTILINEFG